MTRPDNRYRCLSKGESLEVGFKDIFGFAAVFDVLRIDLKTEAIIFGRNKDRAARESDTSTALVVVMVNLDLVREVLRQAQEIIPCVLRPENAARPHERIPLFGTFIRQNVSLPLTPKDRPGSYKGMTVPNS